MDSPLLDVRAVSELLSISPYTVRAYVRQCKLSPIRIGKRVLFEMAEVDRFVEQAKSKTNEIAPAPSTHS